MEENRVTEMLTETDVEQQELCCDFPEEKLFEFDKRDIVFTVLSAIGCVFSVLFGLFGNFALGFCLSTFMLICVMGIYLAKKESFKGAAIICGLLALANTFNFITTSNGSVRFFAFVELLLLCLVFFDALANKEKTGVTRRILNTSCSVFLNLPLSVKSIFTKKDGGRSIIIKILIGVICAIPVLLIVVPLLSSADIAFNGIIDTVIKGAIPTTFKIIFGLFFAIFVISYGFTLRKNRMHDIDLPKAKKVESVYVASFLSAVSVAYLLYLFSQLAYFFSAFNSILPPEYKLSFAEYARRGFFELCAICVINFIIVTLSIALSSKDGKINIAIKILCSFITIFTLIICATAISKMVLYINYFGMTVRRITTSAFMIFLSIVFISLLLRIYIPEINVAKTGLYSAAIILLILGTVNVNAVAAKYNYSRYTNKTLRNIDITASMADLGDEGVPYLVKLAEKDSYIISSRAKKLLKTYYTSTYFNCDEEHLKSGLSVEILDYHKKYKDPKYFTIPKYVAYHSLYEYAKENPRAFI